MRVRNLTLGLMGKAEVGSGDSGVTTGRCWLHVGREGGNCYRRTNSERRIKAKVMENLRKKKSQKLKLTWTAEGAGCSVNYCYKINQN